MNNFMEGLVTVLLAVIGIAIVATIVSPNAQTTNVINAFGNFFTGALKAATGPVSGGGGLGATSLPSMQYMSPYSTNPYSFQFGG